MRLLLRAEYLVWIALNSFDYRIPFSRAHWATFMRTARNIKVFVRNRNDFHCRTMRTALQRWVTSIHMDNITIKRTCCKSGGKRHRSTNYFARRQCSQYVDNVAATRRARNSTFFSTAEHSCTCCHNTHCNFSRLYSCFLYVRFAFSLLVLQYLFVSCAQERYSKHGPKNTFNCLILYVFQYFINLDWMITICRMKCYTISFVVWSKYFLLFSSFHFPQT